MLNNYYVYNQRLAKYLYSIGFDKVSEIRDGKEIWTFQKSDALQEALDFYSYMRSINKKSGDENKYEGHHNKQQDNPLCKL